jgi:membrane-associated phospholipid phosphatase
MQANSDLSGLGGPAPTISRRAALKGIGATGAVTAVGAASVQGSYATDAVTAAQIEPGAGTWQTWILATGDELRPDAPPDATATEAELTELRTMVTARDTAVMDRISYWDAGSPGYRWNELATHMTVRDGVAIPSYRVLALLNVAIYDATVAAWDAKYAYNRKRPGAADPTLETAIPTPASPSYPCEHAVAAGAAATVLAYLFPDDTASLADLADEAANSRIAAGVVYPSDTAAGLELGRQVGERVIAYAKKDGSDAEFDPATMPTGDGIWSGDPTTLAVPTLGTWKTWVLASGDQFRPGPPPAWDSPEHLAEVAEVRNYPRDAHPFTELFFWPHDPAGRPAPDTVPFTSTQVVYYYAPVLHLVWGPELAQKLFEYRWDANPPRAARAYALVSVAAYDATVASWDAKFHYWTSRPDMDDPEIETVLPTYPIPDYPSGHATTLGGTAQVLSYLFPRDERFFQSRADENAASRVWAGIHTRSASEVGVALGRTVGTAVVERAQQDGAD